MCVYHYWITSYGAFQQVPFNLQGCVKANFALILRDSDMHPLLDWKHKDSFIGVYVVIDSVCLINLILYLI